MKVHVNHISAHPPVLPVQGRAGERGAALITALLFMVLLTALGLATVMTSTTEIMTSSNDKLNRQALEHASAGLQMTLAALEAGHLGIPSQRGSVLSSTDPDTDYGKWFLTYRGYTTIDATPRLLRTSVADNYYEVVVELKKEEGPAYIRDGAGYGDGSGTDNNEVVTYSRDCGYPDAPVENWKKAFPVYRVTSTGYVMGKLSEPPMATAVVRTEITKNTISVEVPGGLYSAGQIQSNGAPSIAGANVGADCDDPSIEVPSYVSPTPADLAGGAGNISPAPDTAGELVNLNDPEQFLGMSKEEFIALAKSEGHYYDESDSSWASLPSNGQFTTAADYAATENPAIIYIKPNDTYSLPTNSQNFGLLFVDGNFVTAGNADWKGLIYVTGDLDAAAGTFYVYGAMMSGGTSTLSGTTHIIYDCTILKTLTDVAFNSKMLNWERLYESEY